MATTRTGHGWPRPVPARGRARRHTRPASERIRPRPLGRPLAGIGSGDGAGVRPTIVRPAIGICPSARAALRGAAPSVAIEQARGDGHPCRVDPAHGRHHAETVTAATDRPRSRGHVVPGGQHSVNPRLPGVVFEPAGSGATTRCGIRARERTLPSSSAATALTEVVPMSIPTVTLSMRSPVGHFAAATAVAHGKLRQQGPRRAAGAQPASVLTVGRPGQQGPRRAAGAQPRIGADGRATGPTRAPARGRCATRIGADGRATGPTRAPARGRCATRIGADGRATGPTRAPGARPVRNPHRC